MIRSRADGINDVRELSRQLNELKSLDSARDAAKLEVYLLALEDALNLAFPSEDAFGPEPLDVLLQRLAEEFSLEAELPEAALTLSEISSALYDEPEEMTNSLTVLRNSLDLLLSASSGELQ